MKTKWGFTGLLFTLSLVLVINSCHKEPENVTPPDNTVVDKGFVTGKVLAQNGTTAIPNASVFIDCDGELYITSTGLDGVFLLQAPAGARVLNVQSGTGRIFRAQYNVNIVKDQTTNIPNGTLKLTQSVNLAYIQGQFDNIQTIITDSLGYTADELTVSDLDNLTLLESYGAIFLNCGKNGLLDTQKYLNLMAFVQDGGCIYASDYAVEYLTGDGNAKNTGHHHAPNQLKATCPNGLAGGFIEDSTLCTSKTGPYGVINNCEIVAPDLQAYLGKTYIDINYNLSQWEVIELYDLPWEVLIRDTATYGPLAIRAYINISNKELNAVQDTGWVTICHIPPGNPNNAHTITISVNALQAHLAHGDYLGPCNSQGSSSGVIYFTTFHNEIQGTLSPDVKNILQYFILNM